MKNTYLPTYISALTKEQRDRVADLIYAGTKFDGSEPVANGVLVKLNDGALKVGVYPDGTVARLN